ncbi:BatD family protein [Desulfococcaceae bacterium HSG9]|nr:BatD family protein [Desulfococcaceae bacterium HSG9]
MRHFILIILLIIMLPQRALALEVNATVDRNQITAGETVQLTVTVKNGQGDVDVANVRDFKVISRGTQTSVRIVNNSVSREANHTYTLIPLKTGRLTIPPLSVTSDGKRSQTRPITVRVSKTTQKQEKGDKRDIFVTADVSDSTPYQGEQFIYRFKFFSAVRVKNAGFHQQPEFPGFTAKKIEKDRSYRTTAGGRKYHVVELTYILIPAKTGELTIKPAILECAVPSRERQRQRRNFPFDNLFDDSFFGNYQRKQFSTAPITVKVKPLPDYTGNQPFSGLVGDYNIHAALGDQKTALSEIKTGDSVTLAITVSGTGNIMDAGEPLIPIPEEFKAYKDNPEEKIELTRQGFNGQKVFRQALVPTKAGNYTIQPVQLTYFDVKTGSYRTISSETLTLDVRPLAPGEDDETINKFTASDRTQAPAANQQEVERTGHDILTVKDDLDSLKPQSPLALNMLLIYLAAPPFFYLILLVTLKMTRKQDNATRRMARRAALALKTAQKQSPADESFFTLLYTALVSAILSTAGKQGELLTYTEARDILLSGGCSDEIADNAAALLKQVESARYSGVIKDETAGQSLFNDVKSMVRRLQR